MFQLKVITICSPNLEMPLNRCSHALKSKRE
jgi:hypothetical protein